MILEELIRIPSPSREEKAAADYLEAALAPLKPRRKGNNLWMVKGSGPVILMDAHIDTVRPVEGWTRNPYEPTIEGDILYGLGSSDDGGSVQAMIDAFQMITPAKTTLVLSLSAEEEVSGKDGLESVLPEFGPIVCGIIGEPTGLEMATEEKGLMVLDCIARGKAGHAARGDGTNAIYKAVEDIRTLKEKGFQVTQIEAGTQHNVIPDSCRFVVDVRTKGDNLETLEEIKGLISSEVHPRSTRLNGSSIPADHPLVQAGKALGIKCVSSPSLSNQALCPFPTVKFGPGEPALSHTADEHISLHAIQEAAKLYCRLYENMEQRL